MSCYNVNKYNMIYIKKRPSTRSNTISKKIYKRYLSNRGNKTTKKKNIDFQDIKRNFNLRNTYFPINNNLSNNFRNEPNRNLNHLLNKLDLSTDKERQYDEIFNSERDRVLPDEEDYDTYSDNHINISENSLNSSHLADLLNEIKNQNEGAKKDNLEVYKNCIINLKERINKLEEKNELKNEEIDDLTAHYKNKFLEGEKEKNKINENNEKIQKDLENKEKEFEKIKEENITLNIAIEKMKIDLQNLKEKNKKKMLK